MTATLGGLAPRFDIRPLDPTSVGSSATAGRPFDAGRVRDDAAEWALDDFAARAGAVARDDPAAFSAILRDAFAGKLSPGEADALAARIAGGGLDRPAVAFVDGATLGGALGAYAAADGGTIYLNEALLSDPATLRQVVAQEMGHYLDAVLGGPDAAGDEGRAFAMALDKGAPLSAEERALAAAVPDHGVIEVGGRAVAVEFALPAIAIWLGQGALQTAPDVLIGTITQQLTGVPYTWVDRLVDFGLNLVPGAGQLDTAKKLAKLGEAVDTIVDATRLASKLPTGIANKADAAARTIAREWETFQGHVASGNFERAGQSWGSLIGRIREMQVASRLADDGNTLVDFGASFRRGNRPIEIDVVFRTPAGQAIAGEVKTGADVMVRRGSDNFQRNLDKFIDKRDFVRERYGAEFRVYVDDVSPDMERALRDAGIGVVRNGDLLR
ncbi:hypothetical protein [Sphingomonas lenta]|uniref:Uncharacterized protein n=1 Tax=Sphingomonas lenta TaxID=1141887 RepID=A0A2A2SBH3_9SPHN|nr:hypothetical protein [Sphingomonas lenta]PAX06545.1 hypothetical protein CKY28_15435 [Sphingomonas lenta]